jgi:nicotinamidase-related amidase
MNSTVEPHYSTAALITIDVQVDTLDGQPLEIPGTSEVVPRIAHLANAFRQAGLPIVHVVRLYSADGSNAEPARRELVSGPTPLLRPGTPGRLLAPGVVGVDNAELDDQLLLSGGSRTISSREIVLYKPRWGAFYRTTLDQTLKDFGVDTVVFAGCNFPNCPRTSIYEASERDYRIVLADNGISGLYDQGRKEMTNIGAHLAPTEEICARVMTI